MKTLDIPSLFAIMSHAEEVAERYWISIEKVVRFKNEIELLLDCQQPDEIIFLCTNEFDSLINK